MFQNWVIRIIVKIQKIRWINTMLSLKLLNLMESIIFYQSHLNSGKGVLTVHQLIYILRSCFMH